MSANPLLLAIPQSVDEMEQAFSAIQVWAANIDTWGVFTMAGTPADFTASGAMVWTVEPDDINQVWWTVIGNALHFNVWLRHTSVGGTPDTELYIRLPNSFTPAHDTSGTFAYTDGGTTEGVGRWFVTVHNRLLTLHKLGVTNWSASTNLTDIYLTAFFEIATS